MLYVFYGSDTLSATHKKSEVFSEFLKNNPNAEIFEFEEDNFDHSILEEILVSPGLFRLPRAVHMSNLLSHENFGDIIFDSIREICTSSTHFFFLEKKLDAKMLKRLPKEGNIFRFEVVKDPPQAVSGFIVSDAFAGRNKKAAWVGFQRALRNGAAPEEIHGALFWQLKALFLAKKGSSAQEVGLTPFSFSKSMRLSKNFTESEIQRMLSELVRIYHESRTESGVPLRVSLEKFLLK